MVTQDISWYIIIYLPWTIIMCVKHMVKQCHNPPIMTLDYDMGGLWHCFTICFTHMMMVHGRYRMIYHDISLVTMVYKPTYITFWGHRLSDLSCHHDGAMTIETPPIPESKSPPGHLPWHVEPWLAMPGRLCARGPGDSWRSVMSMTAFRSRTR